MSDPAPTASPVTAGLVIGLVGGVASGKSYVARLFAERGADWIDADALAHEALREPDVRDAVVARFGDGVIGADGHVDRRALGALVLADRERLRALEQLVHPRVRQHIDRRLAAARAAGRVALLDVPLLLEGGHDARCDAVVYVRASDETRRRRAATRGWAEGELARREALQTPLPEKAARADYTIDNDANNDTNNDTNNDSESVRDQVARVWSALTGDPAAQSTAGPGETP